MSEEVNKSSHRFQGLQLFLVQSVICVIGVMIMFSLKVIGGDMFDKTALMFHNAMLQNSEMTARVEDTNTTKAKLSAVSVKDNAVVKETISSDIQTDSSDTAFKFVAPLTGGVLTSSFGQREDPFDTSTTAVHCGLDIGAQEGTPLAAMADGTVEEVGYNENGYGYYVIVSCDEEHQYLYAHCSKTLVKEGQRVTAGETLALVGSTGRSTGNHVHIEWRENGVPVDPTSVVPSETYV